MSLVEVVMSSSDPTAAAASAPAEVVSPATGIVAPTTEMCFRIDFYVLLTEKSPKGVEKEWFL